MSNKRFKRIAVLIPCLLRGGTEIQTLNLIKVLKSFGHEVTVVCYFEFDLVTIEEFKAAEVNINLLHLSRLSSYLDLIFKLRKEILLIKPDIVHIQYMAPGAIPIIAARLARVKTVFATVHQPYTQAHGKLAKHILRISSLLTTNFIAVSLNAEKSWFGSASILDEKISTKMQPKHFTIYNSVDLSEIERISKNLDIQSIKANRGITEGRKNIGAISRLRHEKGVDLLIDAFIHIKDNDPAFDANLIIVGSGPDEEQLKRKVTISGYLNSVLFIPEVSWETAMELISVLDIVVVPSRFEGFGLAAAEAMAFGKPVVSSDCYGLKEVVLHNSTGYNFHVGNLIELANFLKVLIMNSTLCNQLGEEGKLRVQQLFSNYAFSRKIDLLYNF